MFLLVYFDWLYGVHCTVKIPPQPLWFAPGLANVRKLQELPHHLLHAGLWDELRQEVIGEMLEEMWENPSRSAVSRTLSPSGTNNNVQSHLNTFSLLV